MDVLEWPSQSPDMNIIENVWALLSKRINKCTWNGVDRLWEVLQDEWKKLTTADIEALYGSMSNRINALIKAKGWHTKY